jgi:hypothetical protein
VTAGARVGHGTASRARHRGAVAVAAYEAEAAGIDNLTAARLPRQVILTRDYPLEPPLWALVHGGVLYRPVVT